MNKISYRCIIFLFTNDVDIKYVKFLLDFIIFIALAIAAVNSFVGPFLKFFSVMALKH